MTGELIVNGRRIPITVDRYLIGRGEGCDILLPEDDTGVSRRHAMLERSSKGEWTVLDISSRNGTVVNDHRIADRRTLQHGDKIIVGRTVIEMALPRSRPTMLVPSPSVAREEGFAAGHPIVQSARLPVSDVVITPESPTAPVEAEWEVPSAMLPQVTAPSVAADAVPLAPSGVLRAFNPAVQAPFAEEDTASRRDIASTGQKIETPARSDVPAPARSRIPTPQIDDNPQVQPSRLPEMQPAAPVSFASPPDLFLEAAQVFTALRTPQMSPISEPTAPRFPEIVPAPPPGPAVTNRCIECAAPLAHDAAFCDRCGVNQSSGARALTLSRELHTGAQSPASIPAHAPLHSAPSLLPPVTPPADRMEPSSPLLPRGKPPIFYKNPSIAVLLCFFWTGLGQCYNGEIGKGLFLIFLRIITFPFLFIPFVNFLFIPIVIALWGWGMFDAHQSAERINRELAAGIRR